MLHCTEPDIHMNLLFFSFSSFHFIIILLRFLYFINFFFDFVLRNFLLNGIRSLACLLHTPAEKLRMRPKITTLLYIGHCVVFFLL